MPGTGQREENSASVVFVAGEASGHLLGPNKT